MIEKVLSCVSKVLLLISNFEKRIRDDTLMKAILIYDCMHRTAA